MRPTPIAVPALLGALLLWYLLSGQVHFFVHERTVWLIALSVPVLVAMTVARLGQRVAPAGGRLALAALIVPVVVGFAIPARPLGSIALASQERPRAAAARPAPRSGEVRPVLAVDATSLTWGLRELDRQRQQDPDLRGLDGAPALLVGFVHRGSDTVPGQFEVARFMVRCCTADAFPVTMPVRYEQAADLPRDAWVEVEGTIHYAGSGDDRAAVVDAREVRRIAQPSRPYMYP
jgi:putative membrane protein